MITMTIIYLAGLVSGILLVVIALAGWIRQAGKELRGGEHYQAQDRQRRIGNNANAGAAPVESNGANYRRRPDSPITRVA